MITVPKVVRIGAHPYSISFNEDIVENDHCGEVNHKKQEIYVRPGYKPDKLMEILLHELFHCINIVYCNSVLGEEMIDHLGEGITQVLDGFGIEFDWTGIV